MGERLREAWHLALGFVYFGGQLWTFIFLTFFDDYRYTWWNWIIVVPLNIALATIWPIYWLFLRWLF